MNSTILPDLVTGPWTLADLNTGFLGRPKHGLKVFSCFHCGGGSTMGYKLAGFDVVGGVDIDPDMMKLYRANHGPRHSYLMGVDRFNNIPDAELPSELFDIDVLDGSPPCSSFSTAGSREDAWGAKKKFREGQAEQVLDDLFFHFIETARKLRPKVVVAENVKGLILGNARGYVKQIFSGFDAAGYSAQLFLLNSSRMGVPQARERTFFLCTRKDLGLQRFELNFNEPAIGVGQAIRGAGGWRKPLSEAFAKWWWQTPPGKPFSYAHPKKSFFNSYKLHPERPANTITATAASVQTLWDRPEIISDAENVRIQTFPDDYDFCGQEAKYVCGMSVPPLMMQRVATELARALLGIRRD